MGARHFYRYTEGDPVEEVPNVLRWAYAAGEKAEEGEAGSWEVFVDDPDMTADFVGHRRWIVYEDESDDANEVLVDGIVTAVRVAHKGGDVTGPAGRVWTIEIADLNTLFTYRLMTGEDSQFPDDQTDVDRVLQVANSEEMGYFDDLSFVFSGDTVAMDEYNGRGSFTGQIIDQCAQETGKNWYIYSTGTIAGGADIGLWYGFDGEDAYTSPLTLSNDPDDLDMQAVNAGTAVVYPLGADTELRRDYGRQYSAAYGEYQDGAKYIPDDENPYDPGLTLSGRDISSPAPEIKTASRMKRRLLRILRDHATPDEVIKTTVTLPANKATQLRAGMKVAFRATHVPNYEQIRFLRIMSATPKPVGLKGGVDVYEIGLELQGPGTAIPIEGDEAILVATNTVTIDGGRTGSYQTSLDTTSFVNGSVWRWTLTNTQHSSNCYTDNFALVWEADTPGASYVLIRAWGITLYSAGAEYPTAKPAQGGPPFPTLPTDTGTFVVTADATGHFEMIAHGNYSPGVPTVDEQWTVVMERLS